MKNDKINLTSMVSDPLALLKDVVTVGTHLWTVSILEVVLYWNATCKCEPHGNE